MTQMKRRCAWAANGSLLEQQYHDEEWGRPVHDDRLLFEFLILEGAQAGLSWSTILQKREGYQNAFDHFDATKIAAYDADKITELLNNPAIVRNKLKVNSAISNARLFLGIQNDFGSFDHYIWQFSYGQTIQNHWSESFEVPASTIESDGMSKDMKKRGFKFIGTTICYAYMQAVGMVNDHTTDCFCHQALR